MERRRVTVIPVGIVPVRVFAGIEQQPNDLDVSELRGERDRPMAVQRIRLRKKTGRIGETSQSGGSRHRRNPRAAANQRFGGVEIAKGQRRHQRRFPLFGAEAFDRRSRIEQQFRQRGLQTGLRRMRARHEHAHRRVLPASTSPPWHRLRRQPRAASARFDGVRRRLLPVALDAVGGDIVKQGRGMHGWIVRRPYAATARTTRARWTGSSQTRRARERRYVDQASSGTANRMASRQSSARARNEKNSPVKVVESARREE